MSHLVDKVLMVRSRTPRCAGVYREGTQYFSRGGQHGSGPTCTQSVCECVSAPSVGVPPRVRRDIGDNHLLLQIDRRCARPRAEIHWSAMNSLIIASGEAGGGTVL